MGLCVMISPINFFSYKFISEKDVFQQKLEYFSEFYMNQKFLIPTRIVPYIFFQSSSIGCPVILMINLMMVN